MQHLVTRDAIWSALDRPWDLIVIGGGITGAGIFREAARAGLRTLLLEAQDYAAGTSSRSSKLVHGGLRYLKNAQIKVTVESVGERERLLQEGKGLILPLGFIYLSYVGDKVPLWVFGTGLAVYDILGLRWGHKRYRPTEIARLVANAGRDGLLGGYRYFDAQTDDARLVLRVIREGVADGGMALNYAAVRGLLRRADGRVCGVAVVDQAPEGAGRSLELEAPVVINATGAWVDEVRGYVGGPPQLRRLRGCHLIFPAQRFPLARAVTFSHPVDHRPVYALPWEGVSLFGTTDVDHDQASLEEPVIDAGEVDYLLAAVRHVFPELDLSESDVLATLAGIRAVHDTGKADPSKESREHVLWQESGLLSVAGGKLTTFRVMAHDALRRVRRDLPGRPRFRERARVLAPAPGAETLPAALAPGQRLRLVGRYGQEAPALVAAASPGELEATIAGSASVWAELRWAARAEGVVHLEDLLLRRLRLGLLLPRGGLDCLTQIRAVAQPELGWNDARWAAEAAAYERLWAEQYYLPG